jgi:hypothetical protein
MQSESAVGVRHKIYWPHWMFGHHLSSNGDLLFVAGTSTLHSFPPLGFELAAAWACVHRILPSATLVF